MTISLFIKLFFILPDKRASTVILPLCGLQKLFAGIIIVYTGKRVLSALLYSKQEE